MEPIVVGFTIAAVVVLAGPGPIPERIRPTAILAAGVTGGVGSAWIAWMHSTWPPLMLAVTLPVVAALTYKYRWGPGARRAQRDAIASLLDAADEIVRGEARLLTGWTIFGSRRGWLELRGPRLRFTLEDGDVVFDVDVRYEPNLSLGLWRRGQFRLKHDGGTHKLMFGHSAWMDLDEQGQAVEFWKRAVEDQLSGE